MHMTRYCSICGSNQKTTIFEQRFVVPTGNYLHDGYNVVTCNVCGFAFADNIPDQSFFEKYYTQMNKKTHLLKKRLSSNKKTKEMLAEEEFLFRMHDCSIKNIKQHIKKKTSILDVGCHTASLLSLLKKKGYRNIEGLDMSKYASSIAKQRHGIKVTVGSIFDDLDLGDFDLLILTHVLEHVIDLPRFVKQLAKYLNEDGLLYVEVPDALQFILAEADDKKYSSDQKEPFLQFSVEHINYFSNLSLFNLMTTNGFELVSIEPQISTITILTSVWRKKKLIKDVHIETSLKQYILESENRISDLTKRISEISTTEKEIFVWGAGLHTQKLLSITKLRDVKIRAFVDSDPSYGKVKLMGKPIVKPNKLKSMKKLPILISSHRFQEEINKQIQDMNLSNEVILLY
jgi:SAM-dependent methyltransferase